MPGKKRASNRRANVLLDVCSRFLETDLDTPAWPRTAHAPPNQTAKTMDSLLSKGSSNTAGDDVGVLLHTLTHLLSADRFVRAFAARFPVVELRHNRRTSTGARQGRLRNVPGHYLAWSPSSPEEHIGSSKCTIATNLTDLKLLDATRRSRTTVCQGEDRTPLRRRRSAIPSGTLSKEGAEVCLAPLVVRTSGAIRSIHSLVDP